MKKIAQLVISLTAITAVCAGVLAVVDKITRERIATIATLKSNKAARDVLPAGVKVVEEKTDPQDQKTVVFVAYEDDAKKSPVGYASPGVCDNGYGGTVRLMVGITADRKVVSYQVLSANETPGLGAKLGDDAFKTQFGGKAAESLAVKKDGGEIDAITGATITSRAVCAAIADACDRIARVEGKASAKPRRQAKASPEGTLLFDPSSPAEAISVMPKGTVKAVPAQGGGRFPSFVGVDASGKTTGYAVVGTGSAHGPNGDIVLHVLFGGLPSGAISFNPPPRNVNKPGVDMTDMEIAQRTAFNGAMAAATAALKALASKSAPAK